MWEIIGFIVVPLLSAFAGWAVKSLADKKVTVVEWQELAITLIRLGILECSLFYGFSLDANVSLAIPLVVEFAYQIFKKVFASFNK